MMNARKLLAKLLAKLCPRCAVCDRRLERGQVVKGMWLAHARRSVRVHYFCSPAGVRRSVEADVGFPDGALLRLGYDDAQELGRE